MKIATDATNTVIVDGLRVGRLVHEGTALAFYVPSDGGFSQRLLALNGIVLPRSRQTRAIDAITALLVTTEPALEVDEEQLNRELESGYGIFSGRATHLARLRFKPEIARWVSRETWHPQQHSEYDAAGFYLLSVPYSQDTELIMEILRYADDVEVLEPPQLRARVRERIFATQALYANDAAD